MRYGHWKVKSKDPKANELREKVNFYADLYKNFGNLILTGNKQFSPVRFNLLDGNLLKLEQLYDICYGQELSVVDNLLIGFSGVDKTSNFSLVLVPDITIKMPGLSVDNAFFSIVQNPDYPSTYSSGEIPLDYIILPEKKPIGVEFPLFIL